jgi:nicotinamide mononucleotide (NMN) deamidase PncC
MSADVGVGITGVAGPSESQDKAVGTIFIGIDDGQSLNVIAPTYPGNRQRIRQAATTLALVELRKTLLNR